MNELINLFIYLFILFSFIYFIYFFFWGVGHAIQWFYLFPWVCHMTVYGHVTCLMIVVMWPSYLHQASGPLLMEALEEGPHDVTDKEELVFGLHMGLHLLSQEPG